MKYSSLINFSNAGYDVAKEENLLPTFVNETTEMLNYLSSYDGLSDFLSDPWIEEKEKEEIINSFEFNELFTNWLLVIIENRIFNKIEYIFEKFNKRYNDENGISEGIIYSTMNITKAQLEKFEEVLTKKYKKNIKLKNLKDKTLIGGARIEIDEDIIDNTIKQKTINLVNAVRNK